jgi:hypothetical protein
VFKKNIATVPKLSVVVAEVDGEPRFTNVSTALDRLFVANMPQLGDRHAQLTIKGAVLGMMCSGSGGRWYGWQLWQAGLA